MLLILSCMVSGCSVPMNAKGGGRGSFNIFLFLIACHAFFVFEGRCLVLRILRGALGDRVKEKGV